MSALDSYEQMILRFGQLEEIIDWLIWNDPNGVYSDADSEAEGWAKLTIEEARAIMKAILERDA